MEINGYGGTDFSFSNVDEENYLLERAYHASALPDSNKSAKNEIAKWNIKNLEALDRSEENHRNWILRKKLFIGDALYAENHQSLLDDNIGAILSLGSTRSGRYKQFDGIAYHHISINDVCTAKLNVHFDVAADFIERHIQQGTTVLVHCAAGVSRSAAICMAYLIKHRDMAYMAAYMAVLDARRSVCPNIGFVEQLLEYDLKIRTES